MAESGKLRKKPVLTGAYYGCDDGGQRLLEGGKDRDPGGKAVKQKKEYMFCEQIFDKN